VRVQIDLTSVDSLPVEPTWLIHRTLATGYLAILAGTPGVGKSYFSYAMALAVAGGAMFLDRPVKQGRVLYFDEENGEDAQHYVRELLRGMDRPASEIAPSFNWYLDELGALSLEGRYEKMRSIAAALKPRLIVIDTATKALGIIDENDNAEALRHIEYLGQVRRAAGPLCTLFILKHARVDPISGDRDIRGAKAWKGSCNAAWALYRPGRGRPKPYGPTILEAMKARVGSFKGALDILPTVRGYSTPQQSVTLSASIHREVAE